MGMGFSEKYVEESRRRQRFTPLWFRMQTYTWIKRLRKLQLVYGTHAVHPNSAPCEIESSFDAQGTHYQAHGWAFVEGMLSGEFHKEIVKNWPKLHHMDPPRTVDKSYNTGFQWNAGDTAPFKVDDPHGEYPTMKVFLDYLRSDAFCSRVQRFCGTDKKMKCLTYIINEGGAGSEVVPHKDGVYRNPQAKHFLNIIFFITATGGPNSGSLTLSRDNELKDVIFEPPRLENTALIFNSKADFYHGFHPIAAGKMRKVITSQFCEEDFDPKATM